jgi:hypothetical protein
VTYRGLGLALARGLGFAIVRLPGLGLIRGEGLAIMPVPGLGLIRGDGLVRGDGLAVVDAPDVAAGVPVIPGTGLGLAFVVAPAFRRVDFFAVVAGVSA